MICGVKSTCGIRVSHRVHYPVTISDRDRCQNVTTFTGTSIQVNTLRFFKISQGLVLVICFLCRSLVMSSRFFPVHKQTFKTFLGCLIGFSGGSGLNQRGGMLSFRSVKSGGVDPVFFLRDQCHALRTVIQIHLRSRLSSSLLQERICYTSQRALDVVDGLEFDFDMNI